jgi:GT2 family glycosyltransferase
VAVIERAPARRAHDSEEQVLRVLAIVVTHDGRRWLRDCLVALSAQSYAALDVLVVDDASPDWRAPPQLRRIAKRHLRRRRWGFLRTRRPQGFGGAINYALSRVRTDAEMLLFLHDDAVLDRTAVERMVARFGRDDAAAIVGPKVVAWDDPERLEEVGMAVDRFGYPYKGLEAGEIDLGQHDVASEVFFVTSTCMLMRHDVFKQLRGWDARMRAFSEDLDLCWRARVLGHTVVVEPAARARHAIALATGQRRSSFTPTRYYSRRNRLRTVAKNVSAARLVALVPQFVLLSFTEMVGFVLLRQPAEIANLFRAMAWNLATAPQTLSERLRVQRVRKVADRRLRRLTVRESTRLRTYLGHQAERLEQAWGRSSELVARRGSQAAALSRNISAAQLAAAALLACGLLLGLRHFLLSPPVAVGDLLPYPDQPTALWRAWASPWREVGLGEPGPAPPALLPLGALQLAALGAAGPAQKLLVLALGAAAFGGAYRLVAEVADRSARLTSGLVYLLGAVGYAGLRSGDLGALAFGAVAPFVLHTLLAATGWIGRSSDDAGRGVARLAVGSALAGMFVPGSLALLAVVASILAGLKAVVGPSRRALRGLLSALGGLLCGWALLLPWSATWFSPGAPLADLGESQPGAADAHGWAGHGALHLLAGATPKGPALAGLALPLLAVLAVALATGQRRRLALALGGVVVGSAWIVGAATSGALPTAGMSPTQAGVVPAVAYAGLAGLAVAAFRLDLPRRRLGFTQAASLAGLAAGGALLVAGVAPALWRGEWEPGRGGPSPEAGAVAQIDSLLNAEASSEGGFRVLWVGAGGAVEGGVYTVTGPGASSLADLFARSPGSGAAELEGVMASVAAGTTDAVGHALGTFDVRFVVVERARGAQQWLQQRDLALIRSEPSFSLLENRARLERAATYDRLPRYVRVLAADEPRLAAGPTAEGDAVAVRRSATTYAAPHAVGPGALWLSETRDPRWRAMLDGRALARTDAGWGNAFELPAGLEGRLQISYERAPGDVAWLVGFAVAWVVALGAAVAGVRTTAARDQAR